MAGLAKWVVCIEYAYVYPQLYCNSGIMECFVFREYFPCLNQIHYVVHSFGIPASTITFDEFVIINCTTKRTTVSVSWLESKYAPSHEGKESKVASSKIEPMVSMTDACCSVRNWSKSVENKDSVMAWRWKNSSKEIVTCEGVDVELFCNVTGSSYPDITWKRKMTSFPGESLLISNIQYQNHGTYWCEASNGVGGILRKDITLVVEFQPKITVPNVEINGSSVEDVCILQCMVEAYPTPSITWYKEGAVLDVQTDQYYEITTLEEENCTTVSELRVVIVYNGTLVKSRFGNYTCQAQNKHGVSAVSLHLMEPYDNAELIVSSGHPTERKFNVTGFVIGMLPPLFILIYIIIKLGYRSRYAEERPEEDGVRAEPFFISH